MSVITPEWLLATAAGAEGRGLGRLALLAAIAVLAAIVVMAVASRVRIVNLALGFGAAVAMWAVGYVAMMGPGFAVGEALFAISLVCVVAAGFVAARRGGDGASGLVVGLVCASVNLLVVGGLFGGRPSISIEVERHGAVSEGSLFLPPDSDAGTLRAAPADPSAPAPFQMLGLTLAPFDARGGLGVIAVAPKSSADNAHVQPGDVILRIDGRPATDPEQLERAVREERERRASTIGQGAAWVVGLFVVSGFLGWIGDRLGRRGAARESPSSRIASPAMLFAAVATAAVFLLLITGGLVTGLEAGLAVPDWPNSFGHNMLLYPLAEMKGGVYYEHAHRLFGMLVGLTALILVTVVFRSDRGAPVRLLAIAILAAVVVQGLLGALRVTGDFSMSEHRAEHEPSLALAVVHGVLGQAILAGTAVLAAMLSPAWRTSPPARALPGGGTMRGFATTLVFLLVGQLILGACYRHLYVPPQNDQPASSPLWALHSHITLAAIIMILALMTGFRAKAFAREASLPIVPPLGRALHIVIGVQILLGIGALVAVIMRTSAAIPAWEVIVTTAHQATGAILLAMALLLAAWSWRLVKGAAVTAPRPATA